VLVPADAGAASIDVAALGGYPVVVKPNEEGSTVGLTIVKRENDLPAALRAAAEFGHETLIAFAKADAAGPFVSSRTWRIASPRRRT
jgi:D-alanine-D-alanine ligase